jgi:hypothetical protein
VLVLAAKIISFLWLPRTQALSLIISDLWLYNRDIHEVLEQAGYASELCLDWNDNLAAIFEANMNPN